MRLVLVDTSSGASHDLREAEAEIGRDPSVRIVISGDAAKTVSGRHARVFLADNQWWVEDVGSRNGTFMGSARLEPGVRHALANGSIIGLGTTGPRLQVQEVETRSIMQTVFEAAPSAPPPPASAQAVGDLSRTMPLKRATSAASPPIGPPALPPPGIPVPSSPKPSPPPPPPPSPPPPPPPPSGGGTDARTTVIHVALHNNHTGKNYESDATVVTLGRALECSVQIEGESAASVSRIHAEIYFEGDEIVVRDNESRHGTFVNGKKLESPHPVAHGDFIMLGPGGPTFTVDEANVSESVDATAIVATPRVPGDVVASTAKRSPPKKTPLPAEAGPVTRLARASGVVGRTLLFRNAIEEISQKSARKLRALSYVTVAALVLIVGGLVGYQRRQLASEHSRSQAQLDSIRATAAADTKRLQHAFDSASKAAAPREVLDSLRSALDASGRRTAALADALQRAKRSLDEQLAAGDSVRKAAENELARARDEMAKASAAGTSSALVLDSLRKSLRAAEDRAKEVNDQIRAASGANWAQVAQLSEGAVGLVVVYVGKDIFNGSGFAITPSGYFLTNRHVVRGDSANADSVFVIMADQKTIMRADLIAVAPENGPDVSVLRIRGFHGPYLAHVDWSSAHAAQGEGAALIGFPNGVDLAMDTAGVVHTSISSGIFSKVTPDFIQFAGFSIHGSSGSPLFNGQGEVVGIHRAGLKEGPGLGFAVPLARVVPLLPETLRLELGIH